MDQNDKYGDLNSGQIEALRLVLETLKANNHLLLKAVAKGETVPDFTVVERPSSPAEIRDEAFTLRMRNLASNVTETTEMLKKKAQNSLEPAKVHLSKETGAVQLASADQAVGQPSIKIEIETPFGFLENSRAPHSIGKNYIVADVNDSGEVVGTPKVEVRNLKLPNLNRR